MKSFAIFLMLSALIALKLVDSALFRVPLKDQPDKDPTNTFVGCDNAQQQQLIAARKMSIGYVRDGKDYLDAGNKGHRYTFFFGAYEPIRYNTVKGNVDKIHTALSTVPYTFDCKACLSNVNMTNRRALAYVNRDIPYYVKLCPPYFDADPITQSTGLAHETSHFRVVANTDDVTVNKDKNKGVGPAMIHELAISDPAKAITNYYSYEYFFVDLEVLGDGK